MLHSVCLLTEPRPPGSVLIDHVASAPPSAGRVAIELDGEDVLAVGGRRDDAAARAQVPSRRAAREVQRGRSRTPLGVRDAGAARPGDRRSGHDSARPGRIGQHDRRGEGRRRGSRASARRPAGWSAARRSAACRTRSRRRRRAGRARSSSAPDRSGRREVARSRRTRGCAVRARSRAGWSASPDGDDAPVGLHRDADVPDVRPLRRSSSWPCRSRGPAARRRRARAHVARLALEPHGRARPVGADRHARVVALLGEALRPAEARAAPAPVRASTAKAVFVSRSQATIVAPVCVDGHSGKRTPVGRDGGGLRRGSGGDGREQRGGDDRCGSHGHVNGPPPRRTRRWTDVGSTVPARRLERSRPLSRSR